MKTTITLCSEPENIIGEIESAIRVENRILIDDQIKYTETLKSLYNTFCNSHDSEYVCVLANVCYRLYRDAIHGICVFEDRNLDVNIIDFYKFLKINSKRLNEFMEIVFSQSSERRKYNCNDTKFYLFDILMGIINFSIDLCDNSDINDNEELRDAILRRFCSDATRIITIAHKKCEIWKCSSFKLGYYFCGYYKIIWSIIRNECHDCSDEIIIKSIPQSLHINGMKNDYVTITSKFKERVVTIIKENEKLDALSVSLSEGGYEFILKYSTPNDMSKIQRMVSTSKLDAFTRFLSLINEMNDSDAEFMMSVSTFCTSIVKMWIEFSKLNDNDQKTIIDYVTS